jgi:hypothetical protein
VVGYLYIVGEIERLNFILNKGKTNESWRKKCCLRTFKNR